jgi:hypothetical protein
LCAREIAQVNRVTALILGHRDVPRATCEIDEADFHVGLVANRPQVVGVLVRVGPRRAEQLAHPYPGRKNQPDANGETRLQPRWKKGIGELAHLAD